MTAIYDTLVDFMTAALEGAIHGMTVVAKGLGAILKRMGAMR